MLIALAAIASASLFSGCSLLPRHTAIPDQTVPHRIAERATLVLWVRRGDREMVPVEHDIPAGWWVASPAVVEGPDPITKE